MFNILFDPSGHYQRLRCHSEVCVYLKNREERGKAIPLLGTAICAFKSLGLKGSSESLPQNVYNYILFIKPYYVCDDYI